MLGCQGHEMPERSSGTKAKVKMVEGAILSRVRHDFSSEVVKVISVRSLMFLLATIYAVNMYVSEGIF